MLFGVAEDGKEVPAVSARGRGEGSLAEVGLVAAAVAVGVNVSRPAHEELYHSMMQALAAWQSGTADGKEAPGSMNSLTFFL